MEIILAATQVGDEHATVKAVCDEDEKILEIVADSTGGAWAGFGVHGPTYTLRYSPGQHKSLDISEGGHYLEDGELPDGLLSVERE